jgi:lysophospholipase L1-like esterase
MRFPQVPVRRRWAFGLCLALVAMAVPAGGPAAMAAPAGGEPVPGATAADAAPASYVPFVTPVGILATWDGTGGVTGVRGPESITTFPVLGVGAIPATGVSAVLVRVMTSSPTAATLLELWPDGTPQPSDVSTLNVAAGENISNVAVVAPGENGRIAVYNRAGETHIGVDVQGYFTTTAHPGTGGFVPVTHTRLIDTRSGLGTTTGTIPAGGSRTVTIAGTFVPAGATAAFVNLLVPGATTGGWVGSAPPGSALGKGAINYVPGSTQSGTTIKLAADGRVTFYNKGSAAINLAVILQGYFSGVAGGGTPFRPVASRLLNTRTAGTGVPLAGGATVDVQVAGAGGLPASGVAGAVTHLTVTPEQAGYLKAWPVAEAEPELTMMDFEAGSWRTNTIVLRPGPDGKIRLRNGSSAPIHLIVDLQGWFERSGDARAVKVMPMGDSITWGQGSSTNSGYRGPLWLRLRNEAGYAPDFVGTQSSGTIGDANNEGHRGWQIDQLQANATTWITTYQPDVVLLHIGTNDMYRNYQVATAPDRLSSLIDQILAARPGIHVLVAKIVPSTNTDAQARINAYNAKIPAIVAAKGDHVRLVDTTNLASTDLVDQVHPNDAGYAKMSDRWYPVLTGVLAG